MACRATVWPQRVREPSALGQPIKTYIWQVRSATRKTLLGTAKSLRAPAITLLVNGWIARERADRTISIGFFSRRRTVKFQSSFSVLG